MATILLITGLIAFICMLTLMGRTERKISASLLRKTHKISGFIFFILLLVISYFCTKYWIQAGDLLSTRAIFHAVLALTLFIILIVKLIIVQFYKQLLRMAPSLGIIVFCLTFVVYGTSAGYFFLRSCGLSSPIETYKLNTFSMEKGNPEKGALLFTAKCASCHFSNKEEKKVGPGLKNILKNEKLPFSGRPAKEENVKKQLLRPALTMPSFTSLSEKEIADLLAYLTTL